MSFWEWVDYYRSDFLQYLAAAAGATVMGVVRWPGFVMFFRWLFVGLISTKFLGPVFTSMITKGLGFGSIVLTPEDAVRSGAFLAGLVGFVFVETVINFFVLKRNNLSKQIRRDDE